MKSLYLVLLCGLVIAVGFPADAFGNGFNVPVIGARMSARTAFTALADDTTAMYHNPAGLMNMDGYRVEMSITSIYSHTVYRLSEYKDDGAGSPYIEYSKPIGLEQPMGLLPFFGFSGDFGMKKWRFGFALYSPNNAATSLDERSEANYQLVEGKILTGHFNPTVAWAPNEYVSIGLGASLVYGTAYLTRLREMNDIINVPSLPAELELDADGIGYSGDIGFIFHPTKNFSIGLSYISQIHMPFEGTMKFDAGADYLPNPISTIYGEADAEAAFDFPQTVRFGLNYDINPKWSLGFDVAWYDYSVYKDLTITVRNIKAVVFGAPSEIGTGAPIDFVEAKNSKDTWTVSAGTTFKPTPQWEFSAGMMYDESPYPDNTYTILSPDSNKVGFSIGGGYLFKAGVQLFGSYTRLQYSDRVVTQSILNPAANGSVTGKFTNIFGLQMSYRWGGTKVGEPAS